MAEDAPWCVRVLGPVLLARRDEEVATRSPMVRTLLALLTLEPGRPAGTDRLVGELWGDEEGPQDPRAALQVQVTRLRSWLAQVGAARDAVRFEHGGYLVDLPRDRLDALTFAGQVDTAARAIPDDPAECLSLCDAALGAWRGEPFAGCVAGPALEAERLRLAELHLRARELRCEALTALGEADAAIAELQAITAAWPARERPAMTLMSALARAGRRREALAVAYETRRYLGEACGLEPSAGLVELERRILEQGGEPGTGPPSARSSGAFDTAGRPLLVGRARELAGVTALADRGDRPDLLVVCGEAGAGKSTLVAAAAHDMALAGARVGQGRWTGDGAPLAAWLDALGGLGVDIAPQHGGGSVALADAVRTALGNAAIAGPVVLVLEDAHAADDPSLALLQLLAGRPLPDRVALVVTSREPDATATPRWLHTRYELERTARMAELRVAELGHEDVLGLADQRLPALTPADRRRVGEGLWARTRGFPLHLAALLDMVAGATDLTACLEAMARIPPHLSALVRYQLSVLDPTARDVVDALTLVEQASLPELAAVADLTAGETRRAASQAMDIGLVTERHGGVQLRHPLTRQIVGERLPQASRAQLHLAWLDRAPRPDVFEALAHARGADDLLAPARRGEIELTAGRLAYRRGAHDDAVPILAAAEAHLSGVPRVEARVAHGLALAALGRVDDADAVLDAVVDDPTSPVAAVVTAAVGDDVLGPDVHGDPRRLGRLERAAAATAGQASRDRLLVLQALVREERLLHGVLRSSEAISEMAELADRLDDDEGYATVARARAHELTEAPVDADTRLAAAEEAYRLTESTGGRVAQLDATELLLSASLAAGDVERCLDLRWVLAREARRANRPRSIWAAHLVEAALAQAEGRAELAEAKATDALDVGSRLGIGDALGAYGVYLVVKHWLDGRLGEALPLVDQAKSAYPHVAAWHAVDAAARVALGDADTAARSLARYLEQRQAAVYSYFDRPGLCFAAEAAHLLGDAEAGEEVRRSLPPSPRGLVVVGVGAAVLGPVELHLARACLAVGRDTEARARLAAAENLVTGLGWKPWRAVCRTVGQTLGVPCSPWGSEGDQSRP